MKSLILLFSISLLATGCSLSGQKWLGFYYPSGSLVSSDQYIYSPEFKTKEECLDWAYSLKQSRGNPKDEFECGKNCKTPDSIGGSYVCKETVDS